MGYFHIGCTHFGEETIFRYEDRPFSSVMEMDRVIAENWKRVVGEDDIVIHHGDVGDLDASRILKTLPGHLWLTRGNHDLASDEYYHSIGFEKIYDHPFILQGFWMISHKELYTNPFMPYANIYAHVHNDDSYKDVSRQSFCVCAERIGYAPIAHEEIARRVKEEAASQLRKSAVIYIGQDGRKELLREDISRQDIHFFKD